MSNPTEGVRKRKVDQEVGGSGGSHPAPQRTDVRAGGTNNNNKSTAQKAAKPHSSSSSALFDRLEHYLSGKSTVWAVAAPFVLLVALLLANLGLAVYVNPKPLDEQFDDMKHLVHFTFHHYILREETPCDYDGVRFLPWGQAIDLTGRCSCHLLRCPVLPAAERPEQGAAEVMQDDAAQLTVQSLRAKCEAQGYHYDMQESGRTVRTVPVESTETTSNTMHYFSTPVCVQAGQIYYTPTDADLAQQVTYEERYQIGQKTKMVVEDLNNHTLERGRRLHPITVVPATGLFFNGFFNSGNELIDLLLYGGMRRFGGLLADLESKQPQEEEEAEEKDEVVASTAAAAALAENETVVTPAPTKKKPKTSAPVKDAQLLDGLQHHSRQSIFLSALRDGEHPEPDRPILEDDGVLGRMWANALTRVLEHGHSDVLSPTPAYFGISPVSRSRPGDVTRGPMYCFCQGLLVPARRTPLENHRAYASADNLRVSFDKVRQAINAHFREAPLATDYLEKAPSLSLVEIAAQTAAHRRAHKLHFSKKYWPPAEADDKGMPHLLWISRKSYRVRHEAEVLSLATHVGFSVVTVTEEELLDMGAEEQFYLGRYADVVAGMPGPFTALALFMDLAYPRQRGCRTLLEFVPYANHEQLTKDREVAEGAGAAYVPVVPRDVELQGAVLDDLERRGKSLAEAKAELRAHNAHTWKYPGFTDQTAIYDLKEVEAKLEEVFAHVAKCLAK